MSERPDTPEHNGSQPWAPHQGGQVGGEPDAGLVSNAPEDRLDGGSPQESHSSRGAPYQAPASSQPHTSQPGEARDDHSKRATRHRKQRVWPAVFAAGLLGATLASLGTAVLVGESITPPAPAPTQQVSASVPTVTGTPDWAAIAGQVRPAVVAIQVNTSDGSGQGSGVILDGDGRVLTNNHVVAGAEQTQIMMVDGRIFQADIVGGDPTTDLAVVQIQDPPENLSIGKLGTSNDLQVGQPVMAVGSPLGLDSTVTTGIISALERPVMASDSDQSNATITNAIQVDAAINPGNSGGPLFNSAGEVVGINSSIATTSRLAGSVGLGFAIPIDLAKQISDQLITSGVAEHAFLGVLMTDAAARVNGITRIGAKVEEVQPGTPAARAGIQVGDVIVGINDYAVGSAESLTGFVRQFQVDDDVELKLIRNGTEMELTASLTARPEAG